MPQAQPRNRADAPASVDSKKIAKVLKRKSLGKRIRRALVANAYVITPLIAIAVVIAGVVITVLQPEKRAHEILVNNADLISVINARRNSFKAGEVDSFGNWTLQDVKRHLGRVFWTRALEHVPECSVPPTLEALPSAFDPREGEFSRCFYEPLAVRLCSSSWAIAAASAISSRICIVDIVTKAEQIRGPFSPQDFLSCDRINHGCDGGSLDAAFIHASHKGIVSRNCFPFQAKTQGVECSDKCKHEEPLILTSLCKVGSGNDALKAELLVRGPVAAALVLYDDFFVYKGGIYKPLKTARRLVDTEMHMMSQAITIIGWGSENGDVYWLAETGFGSDHGERGFARIAMDANLIIPQGIVAPLYIPKEGAAPTPAAVEEAADRTASWGAEVPKRREGAGAGLHRVREDDEKATDGEDEENFF